MQDVNRGEVALWVVCGHREGHSKAWPAVRMQGRGLIATFLLRFQRHARKQGMHAQRQPFELSSRDLRHGVASFAGMQLETLHAG
jgi:hypothetical protein